jgi:hypothetical protein
MATVLRIEAVLTSRQALHSSGQLRSQLRSGKPVQPRSLLLMKKRTPTVRARTTVTNPWRLLESKPKQLLAATPASSHHGQLPMCSTVPAGLQEALLVVQASPNRNRRRPVSSDLNLRTKAR